MRSFTPLEDAIISTVNVVLNTFAISYRLPRVIMENDYSDSLWLSISAVLCMHFSTRLVLVMYSDKLYNEQNPRTQENTQQENTETIDKIVQPPTDNTTSIEHSYDPNIY